MCLVIMLNCTDEHSKSDLSLMCAVSSVGFAIVLRLGIVGFFQFLIWVVLIDCIGVGVCVATLFWLVDGRLLFCQ